MNDELKAAWLELHDTLTTADAPSILLLCVYLVLGGLISLYLRFLYRWCGASASDADAFTRIFPLLTLVTTGVIAVVKSSLALSLGLVGALSIVRFRSAIKEPEELAYLFLCIAVGLSLGAEQPWLALGLVGIVSVFAIGIHYATRNGPRQRLVLTVSGDANKYFSDPQQSIMSNVEAVVGRCTIQRMDVESGHGQIRIMLPSAQSRDIERLMVSLQSKLPGCDFSYVDVKSVM